MEVYAKHELQKCCVIWFIISLRCTSTVGAYQLVVQSEYTAFSGELEFHYRIPAAVSLPFAFIRVVLLRENMEEEITNISIDSKYQSGTLRLSCGILEVAGKYEFQMHMYVGGPILSRAVALVRWPKIVLQLPETHLAQSSSVFVKIVSTTLCNPKLNRYKFDIDLEYAENSSEISITGNQEILHSQNLRNLSGTDLYIEFPCSLFELSGVYRATLKSSFSAISVVSRSNTMLTTRNPAFKIQIWTKTIYPCFNAMHIDCSLPQCPGQKGNNKVRMYVLSRKSSESSLGSPIEKSYVQEHLVDPGETSITLSCDQLQTEAAGYCFQFVTVARNGVMVIQTELCVSAHPDSVIPIDGGWSEWSIWSKCSATCEAGLQSRYRMCNSPTPNFGGAFCYGESTQKKLCDVFCPDSIPLTPLRSPTVTETCACGCYLTASQGEIIASGRCSETSIWRISARQHHIITLNFKYMNLFKRKQWVKVRNGGSVDSDLIAFSDGQDNIHVVTSTSNEMLVEFYTESDSEVIRNTAYVYIQIPTKPIHVYGFIATYMSTGIAEDFTTASPHPILKPVSPSIWQSTVAIVGIALCGLVVITALSFVIYHHACHKRVHKYALASYEDSPQHICKSTGMMSTLNHESSNVIQKQHEIELPVTSVSHERNKANTHTNSKSSLSSSCSNVRNKRAKSDIKASHREYCEIPTDSSPYQLAEARESTHKRNQKELFRTSPLINSKVPRSLKRFPSSEIAIQSYQRTAANDPCDVLRYTNENKEPPKRHRVVRDHSPTSPLKSPPHEISRKECTTPINVNKESIYRKRRHQLKHEIVKSDHDKACKGKQSDINVQELNKLPVEQGRKPSSVVLSNSTFVGAELGSQIT